MIDLLFKHLGEGRRQGRKPINCPEDVYYMGTLVASLTLET